MARVHVVKAGIVNMIIKDIFKVHTLNGFGESLPHIKDTIGSLLEEGGLSWWRLEQVCKGEYCDFYQVVKHPKVVRAIKFATERYRCLYRQECA